MNLANTKLDILLSFCAEIRIRCTESCQRRYSSLQSELSKSIKLTYDKAICVESTLPALLTELAYSVNLITIKQLWNVMGKFSKTQFAKYV